MSCRMADEAWVGGSMSGWIGRFRMMIMVRMVMV